MRAQRNRPDPLPTTALAKVKRILLGNTGRGGELAIFTSIIKAYRNRFPDAYIRVTTCDNGIYSSIFKNSPDLNDWVPLQFRNPSRPHYMKPVKALEAYFKHTKRDFDLQEFACEWDFSPAAGRKAAPALHNCYKRIRRKAFELSDIPRKVFIYPTDDELKYADDLFEKHGNDLILVSHVANSASRMMNLKHYTDLCNELAKAHPVAYTGHKLHQKIPGHIDLRGIPFSTVFAIASKLKYFVGPDTAITWIVSNMPGRLVCIRGTPTYPLKNTGLQANGYRKDLDTIELDVFRLKGPQIINLVQRKLLQ